jgi:outer membrane receptor protein involved in Fe transport
MPRRVKLFAIAVAAALFLFAPKPASAQVSLGSISGTVVDSTGAVVPQAQITATNVQTRAQSKTTSDTSGLFKLALLPVGSYEIEVEKTGFKKLVVTGVQVSAGTDHGLGNVVLQVGEVATTVQVTAATPLLQTTQAQVTNTMGTQTLSNFPGIQENQGMDYLALSLPGVVNSRDNSFSNSNGVDFSVNGIRSRNNDQQIDGQNNNDNSVAGPAVFVSNPDFVSEYQITTNQFGAEYGRNSGSVVNIITKSGTNNWHGTISATEGNSVLNSLSNTQKFFDGLTKVPRFNNIFPSATIGGPLWKNHIFMFGGFDTNIISSKGVYSTGNLTPTPLGISQMATCYPGSATVALLQSAYGPFNTGGNPTINGTPVTKVLTGANTVDGNCDVQMSGIQRTLSNSTHQYDWVYRVDVTVSNNDRFYGRYLYQKITPFNSDAFGTAAAGYPANVPSLGQDIGLSWTHVINSRMVNEARFSYGRTNVEFGGNSIGNTIPNQQDLANALTHIALPSGYLSFGPAINAPQGRIVNTYQIQDNWSFLYGKHQIRAGVNYTRQRSPNVFLPSYNGNYSFSSMSAFAQNVPTTISIADGSPKLNFIENDTFIYGADDYRVTPNLTLNLGLTWSYYGQPANLFNEITTQRESNPNTAFWNTSLPLSVRTFPSIPSVKNSFGPGVGFAYTPSWGGWLTGNGKTVIRGGYRLTYDPPFYNIYLNIASAAPMVLLQTLSGATAAANPLPLDPFGPTVRTALAPYLQFGVADPRTYAQTTITPNFGPDRFHQWSFGIQRELMKNAVFEARYVGNHGFDQFQSINSNPLVSGLAAKFPNTLPSGVTPCTTPGAPGIGRVNCSNYLVRTRTNTGYSDYNALQLQFRTTNLYNQLTMLTSYTFSKTTDNVSEIFSTAAAGNTLAFSQNPFNYTSAEHGLSGLDIPNAFTLSFVESLPFYRTQHGVVGHILGGWGVASTYILSSGQTYTPVQFFTSFATGGVGQDNRFANTFIGTYETLRPFIGNPNAPATNLGMFAADACNYFSTTTFTSPACGLPADTLVSFNALNTTGALTTINKSQVRFIANGGEAQTVFGTPFGNAARNSLRDAKTNTANITVFKDFKFWEKATLQWHMSMINAFNHPNFSSVDPFIEDAGLTDLETGFANPTLYSGGNRTISFGLKVTF